MRLSCLCKDLRLANSDRNGGKTVQFRSIYFATLTSQHKKGRLAAALSLHRHMTGRITSLLRRRDAHLHGQSELL